MKPTILIAIACGILVGAGLVHGVWSDRWNDGSDLRDACARLESLPLALGDWQGRRVEREADARSGLAGSATYQFTHSTSSKAVTVFIACGRPGPVSVHTPEVCYEGSGFEVERPTRFTSAARAGFAGQEFFSSRLSKKRSAEQSAQRIFWAWSDGKRWQVSENPRLSFAGTPVLFKMYVLRELLGPAETLENDPCVDLLDALIPAWQASLKGG